MGERGIGQIIDTRRFSIPVSQSIRCLSLVIYHAIVIV